MPQFRKKPVVIEAIQWLGPIINADYLVSFDDWLLKHKGDIKVWYKSDRVFIQTIEGLMCALPEDWIIKGVNGELYPCKPDIFEKTYEAL